MLQSFKDRIHGSRWLGYLIVGVISVPFALWGIQAYMRGGGGQTAVSVNGKEISARTVEKQVSQRRRMLAKRLGGDLPDSFSTDRLRQSVVDNLISKKLLEQTASQANIQSSSQAVAQQIRNQRAFQRNGRFDRELYQKRLSRTGMKPSQYEARLARSQRGQQLRQALVDSAFVLPSEAHYLARLQGEQRHVLTLEYPAEAIHADVDVDDAAIQAYYDEHPDKFETPERVRLAYVRMDVDTLGQQIDIPEKRVRQRYESSGDKYQEAATRKAAHILIKVDEDADKAVAQEALEKAQSVRERVEKGASFAKLAREYSQDRGSAKQGGDLGYIGHDAMPSAFEDKLFDMSKADTVSQPVRTRYGYHLIKLLDIREHQQKPFSQVRDRIARELRKKKAESRFYDHVETLKNKAYENPNGLESVADATGLKIHRSGWISRHAQASGDDDGIGTHEAVRQAAFKDKVLKEGQNSNVIKIDNNNVVVVRVSGRRAPEPQPLKAVRDQVRKKLVAQRIAEHAQDWAERVGEQLDQGKSPDSFAGDGVQLTDYDWIDSSSGDTAQPIVRAAFGMTPDDDDKAAHRVINRKDGGRTIVVVDGSRLPDVPDPAVKKARKRRKQTLSRAEFQAWMAQRRDNADISRPSEDAKEPSRGDETG